MTLSLAALLIAVVFAVFISIPLGAFMLVVAIILAAWGR